MKVYNENSLVNLSNSILKHFGVDPFHDTIPEVDGCLKGHKKVVAILFDGMGQNIVRKHLKENSFIRSHYVTTINSTFPPTTSAATTSFLTGKYPIENGWLGWNEYFEEFDRNVILFKNADYNTGEQLPLIDGMNIADKYFPTTKIFELIEKNNPNAKVCGLFRYPINDNGPKSLRMGRRQLKEFLRNNEECFAYFYWDSPDREMHEFGIDSGIVRHEVEKAERFFKGVCEDNPDTVFIIFADHGHINVKYFDICENSDIYALLDKPVNLEKRTPSFFVKPGKEEEFKELFNKHYGEYFELLTKEEAFKMKLFGEGKPASGVEKVIGQFVAVAIKEYGLYASKEMSDLDIFKGHHAGGTQEERLIDVSIYTKD